MRHKHQSLAGNVILLTGATRGIGRAMCDRLVAEGARVLAVASNADALERLRAEFGDAVVAMPCDLDDPQARAELVAQVKDEVPRLDGLINNAGIQIEMRFFAPQHPQIAAMIAREIEINLVAPTELIAGLLPQLGASGSGFVVNVTTGLAIFPKQASPVYCATKAGLRSLTQSLRYQAMAEGGQVFVSEAIMSLVDTEMTQGRGRGKISPERAAGEIVAGLKARKPEIWIGKAKLLRVLARVVPGVAARILR
ncbi:SDR family NAD(P)-dependent oxidoreductase [Hoeflea sp. AS60]|uniref:SDR family oxidoreductase n=1 Tax=Hoeflea sp. AS60 TaxID=3135780 RepID=UPI00317814F3